MNYMTHDQQKKLLELADFLDGLPERNFNMDVWLPYRGRTLMDDTETLFQVHDYIPTSRVQRASEEVNCGTACCVGGWAGVLHPEDWPTHMYPHAMKDEGVSLFAGVYGLTYPDAELITMEYRHLTSQKKAKQIRTIVLDNYEVK